MQLSGKKGAALRSPHLLAPITLKKKVATRLSLSETSHFNVSTASPSETRGESKTHAEGHAAAKGQDRGLQEGETVQQEATHGSMTSGLEDREGRLGFPTEVSWFNLLCNSWFPDLPIGGALLISDGMV